MCTLVGVDSVTINGDIAADGWGVFAAQGNLSRTLTVNGDVIGRGGVYVDLYTVIINGNVTGRDGDPDKVDFTDPNSYSNGSTGLACYGGYKVFVSGNVTGGKGYGACSSGGSGIYSCNDGWITVGGNIIGGDVIAGSATARPGRESQGGTGLHMYNVPAVTVKGNVVGGSTDGVNGHGGDGVYIFFVGLVPSSLRGTLNVNGSSTGGRGAKNGAGLMFYLAGSTGIRSDIIPNMYLGKCSSVEADHELTEETWQRLLAKLRIGYADEEAEDLFWFNVYTDICRAGQGDTVTAAAAHRMTVPVYVLRAAYEHGVTLVIEWNGGDDITVRDYDCGEDSGALALADLAELVKK